MSRLSYGDQCSQIIVRVDGKATGHILYDKGLWFYRLAGTKIDGHRHANLGDVIAELEAAPIDWPHQGAK